MKELLIVGALFCIISIFVYLNLFKGEQLTISKRQHITSVLFAKLRNFVVKQPFVDIFSLSAHPVTAGKSGNKVLIQQEGLRGKGNVIVKILIDTAWNPCIIEVWYFPQVNNLDNYRPEICEFPCTEEGCERAFVLIKKILSSTITETSPQSV